MANYVLEILDGDRAGEVVPIGDRPIRIGRRPGNDLILADEKTSGVHAEIVPEGDRHVLRDLGSTNGTFLDGKRITELVLTPGDEVTIGRWRVRFRNAEGSGAPVDAGELAVRRLDTGRARAKGGAIGLVSLVAVLGLGAAGFWFVRGLGDDPATNQGVARGPLVVDGNKLAADLAACEAEEGLETAAGVTFQTVASGHTSSGALRAERAEGDPEFAVLRLAKPVGVLPGRSVTITAHLRGGGSAEGAVRAQLRSDNEQVPFRFRTGSKVEALDGSWQRVTASIAVPPGCTQLQLEVVCALPAVGDSVTVDDLAVQDGGDATMVEHKLAEDETGQTAWLTGAALALRSVDSDNPAILLAVLPGEVPPALRGLHRAGLAALSDLGATLTVTPGERRFTIAATGVPSLRLVLPAEAAGGLLVADAEHGFGAVAEGPFQARAVLTGSSLTRALWQFDPAVRGEAKVANGELALSVEAARCDVVLGFRSERQEAQAIVRQARAKVAGGAPGEALTLLADLVQRLPMDTEVLAEAQVLRSEILAGRTAAVRALFADFEEAQFFDTRGGFDRVALGVDDLVARYGEHDLDAKEGVRALQQKARERLVAFDQGDRDTHRARLVQLAKVFADAEQAALQQMVEAYVARHLGGDGNSTGGGK